MNNRKNYVQTYHYCATCRKQLPKAAGHPHRTVPRYRAFWFDGERLHPRRPGEISINYWFLTREHFNRLGPERASEGHAEDASFP